MYYARRRHSQNNKKKGKASVYLDRDIVFFINKYADYKRISLSALVNSIIFTFFQAHYDLLNREGWMTEYQALYPDEHAHPWSCGEAAGAVATDEMVINIPKRKSKKQEEVTLHIPHPQATRFFRENAELLESTRKPIEMKNLKTEQKRVLIKKPYNPTPEDLANIERRKAAILEKSAEIRAHKRERERKLREKKKVSRAGNINLLHHRQKKRRKK